MKKSMAQLVLKDLSVLLRIEIILLFGPAPKSRTDAREHLLDRRFFHAVYDAEVFIRNNVDVVLRPPRRDFNVLLHEDDFVLRIADLSIRSFPFDFIERMNAIFRENTRPVTSFTSHT